MLNIYKKRTAHLNVTKFKQDTDNQKEHIQRVNEEFRTLKSEQHRHDVRIRELWNHDYDTEKLLVHVCMFKDGSNVVYVV